MFKRILVPLDGSARAEQALPIAARIVRASGSNIMLLHIITTPIEFGPYLRPPTMLGESVDAEAARTAAYLSNIAQLHGLAGAETKVAVSSGSMALAILDAAKKQHIDLIIITRRGAISFKRWALGRVAHKVARSSPVPVLVLPDGGTVPSSPYPDRTRPLHAIAAAVALDGSKLAEAALSPAANLVAALAAPAQGSLHLTRVVQLPRVVDVLNGQERMDPQLREQAIDEAMDYLCKMAAAVQNSLARDHNLAVTWSIAVATDVANALTLVAEQGRVDGGTYLSGGCDLLAVATHGRSGIPRLALGSVTERILGSTKLPLLVVQPQPEQCKTNHTRTGGRGDREEVNWR
jgi:nucleotide-binding universal stress UspA family protein